MPIWFGAALLAVSFIGPTGAFGQEDDLSEKRRRAETFLAVYRPDVESAWEAVTSSVGPADREILRKVDIKYSTDETPLRFELRSGNRSVLTITVGGLLVESNISDAYALWGGKYITMEWLHKYIVYLRNQYLSGLQSCSAAVAAGVGDRAAGRVGPPLNQTYQGAWAFFRKSALFFTLAHEAAHALRRDSSEQEYRETKEAFQTRVRKQETAADAFAANLAINRDDFGVGFLMLLTGTMYIYEPRNDTVDVNLHLPDYKRVRALTLYLQSELSRPQTKLAKSRLDWQKDIQTILAETEPELYKLRLRQRDSDLKKFYPRKPEK